MSSIDDLLRRIRAVNPTDRALSKRDRERRYTEKSRLQSELLRRFGDAVRVRRDASDERVVALEVGELGDVACHALIDNLDEDARAWVLRRLDEDGSGPPSGPGTLHARSPVAEADRGPPRDDADALLAHGAAALASYDYDGARDAFQSAFDLMRGAEPAARALVGFLVDSLCADDEALALRGKLSREVARSTDVRAYLALAAARTGDRKLASSLLVGLESPRRADALVALGQLDLGSGHADHAKAHAREALAADVGHLGAQALLEEIGRRARDATRSLESQLEVAVEHGAPEDIEALSSQILRQYPESDSAKRAARKAAERRKALEVDARIADAEQAERDGDLEAALAAVSAAARIAPSDVLSRRAADLAHRVRARQVDARAAELVPMLRSGDPDDALRILAREDAPVRAAVLALEPRAELRVMDRLVEGRVRAAEAAEAAIALRHAATRGRDDPDAALALLHRHQRYLERFEEARAIERAARERVRAAARRRAAGALAHAEHALRRDDAAQALDTAISIDPADLDDADCANLERVLRDARKAVAAEDQASTFARLARTEPVAARAMAVRLATAAPEADRTRWTDAADAMKREIDRVFRVWRAGTQEPAGEPGSPFVDIGWPLEGALLGEGPRTWIDPGGESLLLVRAAGHWVFAAFVDLRTRGIVRRLSLRLPRATGHLIARWTTRQTVCFIGAGGHVLEIDPVAVDVLRWLPGSTADVVHEDADFIGGRYLWASDRKRDTSDVRTRVHDVERPGVRRELSGQFFREIQATEGPLVFMASASDDLVVYDAHGGLTARVAIPDQIVAGAVGSPSGAGVVAIGQGLDEDEGVLFATPVSFGHQAHRFGPSVPLDIDGDVTWSAATARRSGLTFVTGKARNGDQTLLLTLASDGERLTIASRCASPEMVLVHDPAGNVAAALVPSGGKLEIVELTSADAPIATEHGATLGLPIVESRLGSEGEREVATDDPQLEDARQRLARCDAALEAGDLPAARTAIDVPRVWASDNGQALARLAAVYLDAPCHDDATSQRRALALALFLDAHESPAHRAPLPLGDHAWDGTKLDALAAAVRAQLDGDQREEPGT